MRKIDAPSDRRGCSWSHRKFKANGTEPETVETAEEQGKTSKASKCPFSGVVSIDLKRFLNSDTHLVECPGCGRTRTLSPVKGVLQFKAHTRRKQQTPLTEKRWSVTGKTDWDVVGG